jgi:hypothetical protein
MAQTEGKLRRLYWLCAISSFLAIAAIVWKSGLVADSPPPQYVPSSFRTDLQTLVEAERYSVAIEYLQSANPQTQARSDKTGYVAIGEDGIVLPGVPEQIQYDPNRDWLVPGTSDAVANPAWQRAATAFADAYNQSRD